MFFKQKEEILECDSILDLVGGLDLRVMEEEEPSKSPSWKLQLDDEPFIQDHMFSVIKEMSS